MNYYDELIQKIKNKLDDKEFKQALDLIEVEYSMPYIPEKFLEKLETLHQQARSELNLKEPMKQKDFDRVLLGLLEDDFAAMTSLSLLGNYNLRNYISEIQSILNKISNPVVTGLLILQLTSQQVDYDFKLKKNGLDIEFKPVYVQEPLDSDGYQVAYQKISDELFKDPQFEQLCHDLLISETLSYLPLSYCELEGESLANAIIKKGFLLSNRSQEWYSYTVRNNIDEARLIQLNS